MARLGAVVTQAIVLHYGRDESLQRLAHPFWFQLFGAVMRMDWHSSGITTSVIGVLKRGLAPAVRSGPYPSCRVNIHSCAAARRDPSYSVTMKKIAAGRVVFWEGGSLWVFDVPCRADAPIRNAMHAHHALQLTFSLGGRFKLHLNDGIVPGPYAVVAPDTRHAFEACGLVSILFIEPESRAGGTLMHLLQGRSAVSIRAEQAQDAPKLIAEAFRSPSNPREALRSAGVSISNRIAGHIRAVEPDRRVRQMIKWASANLDGPVTLQKAAQIVGLSSGRASHLFVEETGLPFRTYVLWLRLVRAVEAHSNGLSLTGAAQEAGFADSAHFSRTFKRMFGLPAAALTML